MVFFHGMRNNPLYSISPRNSPGIREKYTALTVIRADGLQKSEFNSCFKVRDWCQIHSFVRFFSPSTWKSCKILQPSALINTLALFYVLFLLETTFLPFLVYKVNLVTGWPRGRILRKRRDRRLVTVRRSIFKVHGVSMGIVGNFWKLNR